LPLDEFDIQRVYSIHDAKQIIEVYQLWKSQLVFSVAELLEKTNLLSHYRSHRLYHKSCAMKLVDDEVRFRMSNCHPCKPKFSSRRLAYRKYILSDIYRR